MTNLEQLIQFITETRGHPKNILAQSVMTRFNLTRDRSVYYGEDFAIRFSHSRTKSFGNTVLSLSNLQKFDHKPVIICLVTPLNNYLYLANSTFLKKISHSSQTLRVNNIKGSFNGSDIMRVFENILNVADNFERLFAIHQAIGFDENLPRLVEATNNISPTGTKFIFDEPAQQIILSAPNRARAFVASEDVVVLKNELDEKVRQFHNEILLASLIENVNIRGRVIEYLIAGEDEQLKQDLLSALHGHRDTPLFTTRNGLADYERVFAYYDTATDVKTKIMCLNSNPKAYNLDKVLEFLSHPRSVFMFYFVGISLNNTISTVLVSMFQEQLLAATVIQAHWAGRNSRGVTQFEGRIINHLIMEPSTQINTTLSLAFLERLIAL